MKGGYGVFNRHIVQAGIMKIIVDRFEGEKAVLELPTGEFVDVVKRLLPQNAKEGSVISIICDEEATEERREAARKKMNDIFRK